MVPKHPNARYDRLNLDDTQIGGGTQERFGAPLVWMPIASVRFTADYPQLTCDIPSALPKFFADCAQVHRSPKLRLTLGCVAITITTM